MKFPFRSGSDGTVNIGGTLISTANDRLNDVADGSMTTADDENSDSSKSKDDEGLSSLLSAHFSNVFSYGPSGSLSDTFTEGGTDTTTDSGSNDTTDTEDVAEDVSHPSEGEVQKYSDNLYGSSEDSTSAKFSIDSTGAVTTSGTYSYGDKNGFDDSDTTTEPFTVSGSVSGVAVSDTGTDSEKQTVDDVESDSGNGSFWQYPTYLSTSGNYSQSDSFTDDTDDAESGSGNYGDLYLGALSGEPVAHAFSIASIAQASGSWSEAGMAAVSSGTTQSSSGTYSESDTSEVDYDAYDNVSGTLSFDGDGKGDGTGNEPIDSSEDSTSKSLGSFTQFSSFTQTLDGNQPSVFTSVSFSTLSQASSGQNTSYSSSITLNFPNEGAESLESSSTTDSADDVTSGWTSYQQSGSYTSTQDDGLTASDVDISTSQAGSTATQDGSDGSWSQHLFGGATSMSTFLRPSEVSGTSYRAQNTQTDSGNTGSLQSGTHFLFQADGYGTSTSGDDVSDGGGDAWTSDQVNVVAVYSPSGGDEVTQSLNSSGGNVWWHQSGPEYPPPPYNAGDTSSYSPGTPTLSLPVSYMGGPGQIALDGTYLLTEGPGLLGQGDLLAPTPGQFSGSNLLQPFATPPTPGPASPPLVDFANVERKGGTTNGALEVASDKMSAGEGNAPAAPLSPGESARPAIGQEEAKQIPGISGPKEVTNRQFNRVETWYDATAPEADLVLLSKTSTLYTSGAYKTLYPNAVIVDSVQSAADAINTYGAAHPGKKFSVLIADHGRPGNQSIGAGIQDIKGGYIDDSPQTAKERAILIEAMRGKVTKVILAGCNVGGVADSNGAAFVQALAQEIGAAVYAFGSSISWNSKGISIREPKGGGAPGWVIGSPR